MASYSLLPVDHQPEFDDGYSLVPVDYDPFIGEGGGTGGSFTQAQAGGVPQPSSTSPPANPAQSWQRPPMQSAPPPMAQQPPPVQPPVPPAGPPHPPISGLEESATGAGQPGSAQPQPMPLQSVNSPQASTASDRANRALHETIKALVPGAYYGDLAYQNLRQGNYGLAAGYEATAFADALLAAATLGTSARLGAMARTAEIAVPRIGEDVGIGRTLAGDAGRAAESAPVRLSGEVGRGSGKPRAASNFQTPTNPPQFPSIPEGHIAEPLPNGGTVYRRPGTKGNADTVRVMPPTEQYPNGYFRIYNSKNQPLNPVTGNPGTHAETHTPLPSPKLVR